MLFECVNIYEFKIICLVIGSISCGWIISFFLWVVNGVDVVVGEWLW